MTDSDQHLVNLLFQFYLYTHKNMCYYIRWDTFFVHNDYMNEYFIMIYKSSDERDRLLSIAKKKADSLVSSKLYKAMK